MRRPLAPRFRPTVRLIPTLIALALAPLLGACGADEPDGGTGPATANANATALGVAERLAEASEFVIGADDAALLTALDRSAAAESRGPLTIDEPLAESVFPPDLIPPMFVWHDDAADATAWWVHVEFPATGDLAAAGTLDLLVPGHAPPAEPVDPDALGATNEIYVPPIYAGAHSWTPTPETWEAVKRGSTERPAIVTIRGLTAGAVVSEGRTTLMTSKDPVGAPIFYRDVPLRPTSGRTGVIQPLDKVAVALIGWRLRDVAEPESRLLLTGMPSCANCHSFSKDGGTLAMDVDGPTGDKGAYAVVPIQKDLVIENENVLSWNSFPDKPPGHKTIGFLSRISPDARWVVSTVNEALYVANFLDYKVLQVFYPTRGILAIHDNETGEMRALPGADDTDYVHCGACWSPDGSYLVYSRARARDPYEAGRPLATHANDPNETPMQYDLVRIPFHESRGGEAVPIAGASNNGMSNTFPKISPDGKWIVYTKCQNGLLMRPDGKLWIVPAEGGVAREMRCNTPFMNSWHSFSPNGRWMVFSSKYRTPYTQMFLTHIDEEGRSTPPVLIPNSTAANRAVNIPEFVNIEADDLQGIEVPAVNHHRHYHRAVNSMRAGDKPKAIGHLLEAIAVDPTFVRAHASLGHLLVETGRIELGMEHLRRALQISADDPYAHNDLGRALERLGDRDAAIREYWRALEEYPGFVDARLNLAFALLRDEKPDAALVHYGLALEEDPKNITANRSVASILLARGEYAVGFRYLDAVLAVAPDDLTALLGLAWPMATSPDASVRRGTRAVKLATRAVEVTERKAAGPLDVLAAAYAEVGRYEDAIQTAEASLEAARAANRPAPSGLEARLQAYRAGRPFRTSP